jgi:DNA invertase Pin-like site-specific DNA recombinase
MSNLLLSVIRAIAPFEKELIRERQREELRSQSGKGSTAAGNRL